MNYDKILQNICFGKNRINKAKEENLNFHEFWNIEETKQFIDEL